MLCCAPRVVVSSQAANYLRGTGCKLALIVQKYTCKLTWWASFYEVPKILHLYVFFVSRKM